MDNKVKEYLRGNAAKGGAAGVGAVKARPSAHYRKISLAYWQSPEGLARRSAALKKIKKGRK